MSEQLLRRDFPASGIDPLATTGDLPARAQVVVVGGGLMGASIAYHLTDLGREVLLLERHGIASGTSWHAAGLVVKGRARHVLTELASYGVDLYGRLGDETGVDVNLVQPGSLTLARTQGRRRGYAADRCRRARRPPLRDAAVEPPLPTRTREGRSRPFVRAAMAVPAGRTPLAVLQWICTKDVDVAVGRSLYTLMLDESGAVALAYLPAGIDAAGRFEVDCAGTVVAATLSDKPFYDPGNQRLTA